MVKNISGGNKTKKQKRNFGRFDGIDKIDQEQMFAQIVKNHGGTFSVLCSDGITRLGKLSGFMKKGPRLTEGSYVIISLREFESEHKNCDIIAYGNPPSNIINLFKKNDPNSHKKIDIDFVDSDDEFKEFEESKRTIQNKQESNNSNNLNNSNNSNDKNDFNWDDI